jgi:hypothetical protein
VFCFGPNLDFGFRIGPSRKKKKYTAQVEMAASQTLFSLFAKVISQGSKQKDNYKITYIFPSSDRILMGLETQLILSIW